MGKTIVYVGSYRWKYYLINIFTDEAYNVSEKEFLDVVGTDRITVPMHYDKDNINRQNFFIDDKMIGYRVRGE